MIVICRWNCIYLNGVALFVAVNQFNSFVTLFFFFFFQAEDGIRDLTVTGVQTCALPIYEDDRQLPQLGEVQLLVEQPLAQRALAEEAHRHLSGLQILRREGRAGGNPGAAADDRVGAQVAGARVGDVHRPALALAVAGFLAEQLGEHQVRRRALGQAVAVTAVRARDVVVVPQRLADADGNRFLADIEVRQAWHQRAGVEIVHALFEQPDGHHPVVEANQLVGRDVGRGLLRGGHALTPESAARTLNAAAQAPIALRPMYPRFAIGGTAESIFLINAQLPPARHGQAIPDMRASTLYRMAKSCSPRPCSRAVDKNSLTTVPVGNVTCTSRARSSASITSFCIMFALNIGGSGIFRTHGPLYCTSGEAIALLVSTSIAVSRATPAFSAKTTLSANASIWTAMLMLVASFMDNARPFSPM